MSTDGLPADAAAGEANLPVRKRKTGDISGALGALLPSKEAKMPKTEDLATGGAEGGDDMKPLKREPMSKAREVRLEQNRKAARESRRRKKNMVEELQRSVVFFSRANSTLKQQNDELTRLLMQAQTQVAAIESGQQPAPAPTGTIQSEQPQTVAQVQGDQQQAEAIAQQALYETQGFPSAAARTAAQTMGGSETASTASGSAPVMTPGATSQQLPVMQTGATMQAMANFQQAAAAAMASAMGMNAPVPAGTNPNQQQAYTDAMNAMVMQQAAAAAAGGQAFPFLQQAMQPGMFQGVQFPVTMGQPTPAPADATQQQVQPQATTEPQG